MDQDITSLKESVRALAEAVKLLPDICQPRGAAFNSEPYRKFTKIIEDVLVKTAPRQ